MSLSERQKKFFSTELMRWHREENVRSLPWKKEKDPYRIWLSEIILQQTRAEQGLPYYLRFVEHYPTINDLAAAPDEEVFRLWQGLGYYNRCKNLLHTARMITNNLKGKFPSRHEDILQLKGIGNYTAAAIASFAFNLPHAVVDGNVYRVLARYFGIDTPSDTTEGKRQFQLLADELLVKEESAAYNQAIMDLGATVCTPLAPKCEDCPLRKHCIAFKQGLIHMLPVKAKKLTVKKRYFHYVLLIYNGRIWIRKRTAKDIWQNLYEPVLIESERPLDTQSLVAHEWFKSLELPANVVYEGSLTQRLTHQLIETRFFTLQMKEASVISGTQGEWVSFNELKNYPFPKTLVSFLEKKVYF